MQQPTHAYIPGKNERHPEDAFDAIRNTVVQGHSAEQLAQSDAFKVGLQYLDAGFYWEAHEVLEPVWVVLPEGSEEKRFVQAIIQLANGCLKLRMDKPKAALRLTGLARGLMPIDAPEKIMTLNVADVHARIDKLESDVLFAL